MSLVFALIRRASQSLNALIRHRSGAGRVLFFAVRGKKEHFYSAEIQKGGTLGPATMLPRIPFKSIRNVRFQVRNGLIFLPVDGQFHIYSPHTGEVSTLPDVPTIPGNFIQLDNPPRIGTQRYFGFDPLSNEHKVLVLQKGYGLDESPMKALFWIFSRGSGSWSRIHPVPPEQRFDFESFKYFYDSAVCLNGAIHWIHIIEEYHWNYDAEKDEWTKIYVPGTPPDFYILVFDMTVEKFRKITRPPDCFLYELIDLDIKLTEFGGRLAFIEDFTYSPTNEPKYDEFQCWILEDYKNQRWVKKTFHLPFEWMLRYQFQAFNYNTGEILLQSADVSRGTTNGECLLYYNTKTGIFRKAEVTGLTPCQAESLKREVDIFDVTFDG